MRRAAAIPFSDGRPISSKMRSGFSSAALLTASNPSESSPMISNSGCCSRADVTNARNGSKSSTTRMRIGDLDKEIACLFEPELME